MQDKTKRADRSGPWKPGTLVVGEDEGAWTFYQQARAITYSGMAIAVMKKAAKRSGR